MKIALVEDNQRDMEVLLECIERWKTENSMEISTRWYQSADTFLQEYRPGLYDLVFLDIEMPMLDGFSAAQELREHDPQVMLIFVTNLSSYAIKGYSVGAFDYFLKPITWGSFCAYFSRAVKRMAPNVPDLISLRVNGKEILLRASSIYYVECQNHTLRVVTEEKTLQFTGRLGEIEQKLSEYPFYRCHAAFVINLRYVEGYVDDTVMVHSIPIPVSRRKRTGFLEALSAYMDR